MGCGLGTGEGIQKWQKCFDCGQEFHGAVRIALGWACWKMYLGRPEADYVRCMSMGVLGGALRTSERPKEALPVLEASLALRRRYFSEEANLVAQTNLAVCLGDLGRDDEALVLKREVYTRRVATLGASHENTFSSGNNLANSFNKLGLWSDAKTLLVDQLLPAARRSLGSDHRVILCMNETLVAALTSNPERTRDNLRLNRVDAAESGF